MHGNPKDGTIRVGPYACTSAFIGHENQDMTRIGVVGHEMSHMFGLPDMLGKGSGVGNFDCMGNMWGQDNTQYHPGLMSAWSRIKLGWMEPTILDKPGTYSIQAAVEKPQAYKITQGFPPGEYLLVENRIQRNTMLLWTDRVSLSGTLTKTISIIGR
jgi:M6 family metalloprotease-like protein